jgi:hypothetical protein
MSSERGCRSFVLVFTLANAPSSAPAILSIRGRLSAHIGTSLTLAVLFKSRLFVVGAGPECRVAAESVKSAS